MPELTDEQIEQEIQAKGLTAPRITPDDIEGAIVSEHYFTAAQGEQQAQEDRYNGLSVVPISLDLLTFCVLIVRNRFTVTGESACISAENFDAELGRKIARQKAIDKLGSLMGYALAEKLRGDPAISEQAAE